MKSKQTELKREKKTTIESYIANKVNYSPRILQTEPKKPRIFIKKVNVDNKTISLNNLGELHGLVRHFPPAAQEWVNSVYSYNSHYNKLLTIADNKLVSLVKSYVNIRYKRTQKKKKLKKAIKSGIYLKKYRTRKNGRLRPLKKRLSVDQIFVAKGSIKHTSNTAIVTFFIYKKANNILWMKNLKKMIFLIFKGKFGRKREPRLWDRDLKYKYRKQHRRTHFKHDRKKNLFYFLLKNKVLSNDELKTITMNKLWSRTSFRSSKNLIVNPLIYFKKKGSDEAISDWKAKWYVKMVIRFNRHIRYAILNERKFHKIFLENFRRIASKIYNKNVIFNFVKLRKFYLNSNIYTQIISLKLKRRELSLSSVLGKSLNNIKLPRLPAKMKVKILKKKLRVNILYHKIIFDLLTPKEIKFNQKFWFELLLFKYNRVVNPFSLFGRMKLAHRKRQNLRANKKWVVKKQRARLWKYFQKKVKFIKNKILAGVRVEARGRLTKRFKASRSVYKLKWIGGLRNIDSSYKGLPAVMLRGHDLSNVEYTVRSSKRKIGAYGVKGWVSSL